MHTYWRRAVAASCLVALSIFAIGCPKPQPVCEQVGQSSAGCATPDTIENPDAGYDADSTDGSN